MSQEEITQTVREILCKMQSATPFYMDDLKAMVLKGKSFGCITHMECLVDEQQQKYPDRDYSDQRNKIQTFKHLLDNFTLILAEWQKDQSEKWKMQKALLSLYSLLEEKNSEITTLKRSIEIYIKNEQAA